MDITQLKKETSLGIVGGAGRMGIWAFELLKRLGYPHLHMYDIQSGTQEQANRLGITHHETLDSLVAASNIVIVSVPPAPLRVTIDTIDQIGPMMKEGQLFSDFTSKKKDSCAAMAKYGAEVIGIHPMFANTVTDLSGQNIALTPVEGKSKIWLPRLEQMLGETPANIRVLRPDVHDIISSFNQSAINLSFQLLGGVLKEVCRKYKLEPEDFFALSTPNSKIMEIFVGRYFGADNPAVAFGIQGQTEYAPQIREIFAKELQLLDGIFTRGDFESFSGVYHHIRSKIGRVNLEIASEDSKAVVALLKELGNENRLRKHREETAHYIHNGIFAPLNEMGAVALYTSHRPSLAGNQHRETISGSDLCLATLAEMYTSFELQYRTCDYRASRESAVNMKHYLGKNVLKELNKLPALKVHGTRLQSLQEHLTGYIGRIDRLISYGKHTK